MNEKFNLKKVLKELSKDQESPLEELFNYYYPRLYEFSRSFLKLEQGIDDCGNQLTHGDLFTNDRIEHCFRVQSPFSPEDNGVSHQDVADGIVQKGDMVKWEDEERAVIVSKP